MNRLALLGLTGAVALSACSTGSGALAPATHLPGGSPAAVIHVEPYHLSLVHSSAIDAALRAGANAMRTPKTTLGGVPASAYATDAPVTGLGAQVNIALRGVQAIGADGSVNALATYLVPTTVNFLDLQRSALVLGMNAIPAIPYTAVRLVVAPNESSVVSNGQSYPVKFGSFDAWHNFQAMQTSTGNGNSWGNATDSLNIDIPMSFNAAGTAPNLLFDFNAMESVTIANGWVAEIGPKMSGTMYDTAAVIDGSVVNTAGLPVSGAVIRASSSDGTINVTTQTDASGSFEVHAIPGGTYSLTTLNSYTAATGDTLHASGADPSANPSPAVVTVGAGMRALVPAISD